MRTSPSVSTTSGRAGMADLAGTRVRRRRTIIREVQSHRLHLWDGTEPDPRYMTYAKVRRGWAQAACDCGWHTERVVESSIHLRQQASEASAVNRARRLRRTHSSRLALRGS